VCSEEIPSALDVYALVNYGGTLQKRHFISRTMLMQQMGGGYEDVDNFRRKTTRRLAEGRRQSIRGEGEKIKGGICSIPTSLRLPGRVSLIPEYGTTTHPRKLR
jgi:hypothetical protein